MPQFDTKTYQFVCDIGGLAASGVVTTDVNGNAMVLPQGFVVDEGSVTNEVNGVLNNTLDVGTAADPDALIAAFSLNGARAIGEPILGTGKALANAAKGGLAVQARNSGSAGIPAGQNLLTINVVGHFDHTA